MPSVMVESKICPILVLVVTEQMEEHPSGVFIPSRCLRPQKYVVRVTFSGTGLLLSLKATILICIQPDNVTVMIATCSKEINFFMASGIDQFRETTQAKFHCKYFSGNLNGY